MSAVALERVSKDYDGVRALHDLDLEVGDGELLVVLGPSGCGKSTLLRVVAGLEHISAGRVLLGGRDVTRVAAGKRNVSMVFQSYALFPHLTTADNIGFGLQVRGAPAREVRARVRSAAELVGCEQLLERRPSRLSGGQRQRVALARALAYDPEVLFFDEPLSAIDYKLKKALEKELKDLHKETGKTFIYITHSLEEAMVMSDRIGVMRAGRLVQVGTPEAARVVVLRGPHHA